MCVDGQQRLTTTSLFLAALADHLSLLAEKSERQEECQVKLRQVCRWRLLSLLQRFIVVKYFHRIVQLS